jgi:hypothetical protein
MFLKIVAFAQEDRYIMGNSFFVWAVFKETTCSNGVPRCFAAKCCKCVLLDLIKLIGGAGDGDGGRLGDGADLRICPGEAKLWGG